MKLNCIVHRDLKPDNVMIVSDPHMPHGERTKLLDFGIAKFTGAEDMSNTRTQVSAVMGSPSYMSPEQCRGAGQVDDRTDVYALGCMLYEMLSGRPPFVGESMAEVMAKHQFEPPLPLAKRTTGLPVPLLLLVDRLLVKDKAQRPSMSQLLEALEKLREQLPQVVHRRSARMPVIRAPAEAVTMRHVSTLGHSVGQGLRKLQQTPRALVILAAALITLAVFTPLWLDLHKSPAVPPRASIGKGDKPESPPLLPPATAPAATLPNVPPASPPTAAEPVPAKSAETTATSETPQPGVTKPARGSRHRSSERSHKRRHGEKPESAAKE